MNWKKVKVKDIAENIQYGYTESSSKEIIGPKFLRITDIQYENVDWNSVPYCKISNKEKSKYLLKDGDLVFARTGATVGKSFLIQREIPEAVFASYLIRLRFSKEVLGQYVSCFFKSPSYWNQISEGQVGAGQANVNGTKLGNLLIPLPPLPTQRAIAARLDRADALRQKDRQLLRAYDDLAQSVFVEMFGDPVKNEKGWEVKEFGNVLSSIRYGTSTPPKYQSEGIPFIRATNIKNGRVEVKGMAYISSVEAQKIEKCLIKKGNLILVRSGANTGDCAKIDEKYHGSIAGYDLILEIEEPYSTFYNFLINSAYGKSIIEPLARRAGQPHLNAEQVKRLLLYVPPLPLQTRFAAILANIEQQKELVRKQQAESEALFGRLLQEAFG